MTIFIYRDDRQYGPYTSEDVRRYLDQGFIVASDLARTSEMTTSVTVESLLLTTATSSYPSPATELWGSAGSNPPTDGNPFTWPFHQNEWWRSLWMPLLWWIPVFGTLISFGWSIGVIRRRAHRQPELPQPNDLGTVLKDGFVVAIMSIVYFVIPSLLFIVLIQFQLFAVAWHLLHGGWIQFLFNPGKFLWLMFEKGSLESLLAAGIIPLVCAVMAWPFFAMGELRYATTGKIRSFFNLFGNLRLMFRHFGGFVSYLFFVAVVRVCLYSLSSVLTSMLGLTAMLGFTLILALVTFAIPPVVAHWITARLGGTLAREIHDSQHA